MTKSVFLSLLIVIGLALCGAFGVPAAAQKSAAQDIGWNFTDGKDEPSAVFNATVDQTWDVNFYAGSVEAGNWNLLAAEAYEVVSSNKQIVTVKAIYDGSKKKDHYQLYFAGTGDTLITVVYGEDVKSLKVHVNSYDQTA